jgi:hypothetical protein
MSERNSYFLRPTHKGNVFNIGLVPAKRVDGALQYFDVLMGGVDDMQPITLAQVQRCGMTTVRRAEYLHAEIVKYQANLDLDVPTPTKALHRPPRQTIATRIRRLESLYGSLA